MAGGFAAHCPQLKAGAHLRMPWKIPMPAWERRTKPMHDRC
jgi:hypothetical protein